MNSHLENPTILYVDSSKESRSIYKKNLADNFNFFGAENLNTTSKIIEENIVDVLIINDHEKDPKIWENCKKLRKTNTKNGYLGIIILTDKLNLQNFRDGMDYGIDLVTKKSDDFFQLQFHLQTLVKLKKVTDEFSEKSILLQIANDKLVKLSITDDLTGLYNMRYITDHLKKEFTRSIRYNTPLSVIMIDIDNLKEINDQYNHIVGSSLVNGIGQDLASSIRDIDIIGRYGGDEFIILLPETKGEGASLLAKRLLDRFSKNTFTIENHEISASISLGIASYPESPLQSVNYVELIRGADQALHKAKNSGKAQAIVFDSQFIKAS